MKRARITHLIALPATALVLAGVTAATPIAVAAAAPTANAGNASSAADRVRTAERTPAPNPIPSRRRFTVSNAHVVQLELTSVYARKCRTGGALTACDNQRRFGETVARVEGLGTKTTRRKCLSKTVHSLATYRLASVKRQRPRAQIKFGFVVRLDSLDAQVVREIRAAARIGTIMTDGIQPPQRALQERHRRHHY